MTKEKIKTEMKTLSKYLKKKYNNLRNNGEEWQRMEYLKEQLAKVRAEYRDELPEDTCKYEMKRGKHIVCFDRTELHIYKGNPEPVMFFVNSDGKEFGVLEMFMNRYVNKIS